MLVRVHTLKKSDDRVIFDNRPRPQAEAGAEE
jgi:hypothetical protein